MNVIDAIRGRRSVRDFTDQPVGDKLIEELVDAAIHAPNAMNRQAWCFVAVTERAALGRIARKAKDHRLESLEQTPELAHLREELARPDFDIFYGAPVLIVICATAPDTMADHDCCLAAENLMLAAHSVGLGSCWIGLSELWLSHPDGRVELGLPAQARPVAPIILGHPRARPAPPGRRPAEIRWIKE